MSKILLVTLQGSINIGNRLQNYALQSVLEKIGCNISTPKYIGWEKKPSAKERVKNIIRICLGALHVSRFRFAYSFARRIRRFKQFDKKHIHGSFELTFSDAFCMDWSGFDAAICGSDQVWYKGYGADKELEFFYLMFMPQHKRYTYAPSFGFEKFREDTVQIHKEGLLGIRKLSCREQSGQEMIRELTGREAVLLCDPTLLIDAEEWSQIARRPAYLVPKHFALEYYVVDVESEVRQKVKEFAREKGITIINIYDQEELEHYCTSPEEFLWLVKNADYILTNSFHGCVFAILFHKNFIVFRRGKEETDTMFDRIRTILGTFGMEQRIYNGNIDVVEEMVDVNAIEKALTLQRAEAQRYLEECACLWRQ